MSIQSIQLADLRPPARNPCSVIADDALDELAASIRSDGLLQNLVVAPSRGKTEASGDHCALSVSGLAPVYCVLPIWKLLC